MKPRIDYVTKVLRRGSLRDFLPHATNDAVGYR